MICANSRVGHRKLQNTFKVRLLFSDLSTLTQWTPTTTAIATLLSVTDAVFNTLLSIDFNLCTLRNLSNLDAMSFVLNQISEDNATTVGKDRHIYIELARSCCKELTIR